MDKAKVVAFRVYARWLPMFNLIMEELKCNASTTCRLAFGYLAVSLAETLKENGKLEEVLPDTEMRGELQFAIDWFAADPEIRRNLRVPRMLKGGAARGFAELMDRR